MSESGNPDRLFVPLETQHYRAFEEGLKEWELRGINHQFNEETVVEGREVELRRGYSTDDSLWGTIVDVKTFEALEEVPVRIDHRLIVPNVSKETFLEGARDLLGQYEQYIAFRPDLGRHR